MFAPVLAALVALLPLVDASPVLVSRDGGPEQLIYAARGNGFVSYE